MAGKTNFTNSSKSEYAFAPENGQAFCQGMNWRSRGPAINQPITDNPFPPDPEGELWQAWNDGWNEANAAAGGTMGEAAANCPRIVGVITP